MPAQDDRYAWQRVASEYGPDLKLFRTRYDFMTNPRNQLTEKMIVIEAADSVQIVAITPQEEVLSVRQYRFGTEMYTMELPGGLLDPGEDPLAAAARELEEETGWRATQLTYLGKNPSNPVFMNSYIYTYLATGLTDTGQLHLDPGEDIDLHRIPLSELRSRLYDGFFVHPHTIAGLVWALGQLERIP